MSEQQNKPTEQKDGPKGSNGKKFRGGPKFNFSFYWIYGIIIVVLIITQLFQWGGAEKQISVEKFEKEMLIPGDVDKIVVINRTAHITIKKDRLADPKYKKDITKRWGTTTNEGPH